MVTASGIKGRAKSGVIGFLRKKLQKTDLLFLILLPAIFGLYLLDIELELMMVGHFSLVLIAATAYTIINRNESIQEYSLFFKSLILLIFASIPAYIIMMQSVAIPPGVKIYLLLPNMLFALPPLVKLSYEFFRDIPGKYYKTWDFNPEREMPDFDMLDMSVVRIIQFSIKRHPRDNTPTSIRAKGLPGMKFSDFFHIFLVEYNEKNGEHPIILYDRNKNTFLWQFIKKNNLFSTTYIDPDLTMEENGIEENTIITGYRIRKETEQSN